MNLAPLQLLRRKRTFDEPCELRPSFSRRVPEIPIFCSNQHQPATLLYTVGTLLYTTVRLLMLRRKT